MRAGWLAVVLCGIASTADADDTGINSSQGPVRDEGTFFKLGAELGTAFARDRGIGVVAGVAATLVNLNSNLRWIGAQADVLADSNGDADIGLRWTLGPEAGYGFVGGDVSYFGEQVNGSYQHGIAVRPKFTIGVAAVYVRYTYAFYTTAANDYQSFEVGIQIKPLLRRL